MPRVGEAVVAVVVALITHAVEDVLHVHLCGPGRVAEFFPVGREGAEDVGVVGLLCGDHIDAGDGDAADRFALLKPGVAAEREALHDAFGKAVAAREAHRVARARRVVGGIFQVLLGERKSGVGVEPARFRSGNRLREASGEQRIKIRQRGGGGGVGDACGDVRRG